MFSDLMKLIALAFSKPKEVDMFYSPNQEVVDLTSLMKQDFQVLKNTFTENKNDFIKDVLAVITGDWDPEWKYQRLRRKTLKASYDDLSQMRYILDEHQISYKKVVRKNPIRIKSVYGLRMIKRGELPMRRFVHRDLKRHIPQRVKT